MKSSEAADIVDALYRNLLDREADEAGRALWTGRLVKGEVTVAALIAAFAGSKEYFTRVQKRLVGRDDVRFTNDTSQFGETFHLLRLWVAEHQGPGLVVDVGARGRARSNSYDLMKHFGWRGLLVEANPALIPEIQRDFAGLDVEVLNCAVSNFEGRATLSLGVNDDVSSLNATSTKAWGALRGAVEVEVRKLEDILSTRQTPHDFDLLSVDIEGEDIKVLNALLANSLYRPRWIIIEASYDYSVRSLDDLPFSDAVKSTYTIRAQTPANLILGLATPPP